MSTFVSNPGQKVRLKGLYKSLGVPTAPGAGATAIVTKPDGTAFAGSPFAVTDDGNGNVHVDITMPATDYGVWWVQFTPGSICVADRDDWWTHSPPQG